MPYQIQLQRMGQNRREQPEASIAAVAELNPTYMMVHYYALNNVLFFWVYNIFCTL